MSFVYVPIGSILTIPGELDFENKKSTEWISAALYGGVLNIPVTRDSGEVPKVPGTLIIDDVSATQHVVWRNSETIIQSGVYKFKSNISGYYWSGYPADFDCNIMIGGVSTTLTFVNDKKTFYNYVEDIDLSSFDPGTATDEEKRFAIDLISGYEKRLSFMYLELYLTMPIDDPTNFTVSKSGTIDTLTWVSFEGDWGTPRKVLVAKSTDGIFGIPTGYKYLPGGYINWVDDTEGTVVTSGSFDTIDVETEGVEFDYKIWTFARGSDATVTSFFLSSVYYSSGITDSIIIDDPQIFNSDASTTLLEIDLTWTGNTDNNNVVVAFSTGDTFGTPTLSGYTDGDYINWTDDTEGVVLTGCTDTISYNHTGLIQETTYYYKIWSNILNSYSPGIINSATTINSIDDPVSFDVSYFSGNIILLTWTGNTDDNNILLASGTTLDDLPTTTPYNNYVVNQGIGTGAIVLLNGDISVESYNDDHSYETGAYTIYYKIWSKDGLYYSPGIVDSITVSGPPDPIGLGITGVTSEEINIGWTLNGYPVLFASGLTSDFGSIPIANLAVGDSIGPDGGTVLLDGIDIPTAVSYVDYNPNMDTPYTIYYKVWSKDGTSYSPGVVSGYTVEVSDPTNFLVELWDSNQILISWGLNDDSDDVLFVSGRTNDFGPLKGDVYVIGDTIGTNGQVLLDGYTSSAESYIDISKQSGPYTIYYKAWSKNESNYSSGVTGSYYIAAPIEVGGFRDGKFFGGYFTGTWFGGRWVDGYFLSGATWCSSSPKPRT